MARTSGAFIKDLQYEKFFAIIFRYRDLIYVYCKPLDGNKTTFVPLNIMKSTDLKKINIFKYPSREKALYEMAKIPMFEIGNNYAEFEVVQNTHLPELF